ncbi:MAG TPA: 5-dehydro-4-deoxy-D-glucuronate isomerase [Lacunisphaera sp.]|nr:5-dehydro-4-deoxy-D-glucuronate isomerase [Lacunisphaera sp.]
MHYLTPSAAQLVGTYSTEQLREEFLATGLFESGNAKFRWWEVDRTIMGGIVPLATPLALPDRPELRAAFFLERREAGAINLGGPGTVRVDGREYPLDSLDTIYLGRGTKEVVFASRDAAKPARIWFISYPAHLSYPVRHVPFSEVKATRLGARETANERLLYKVIYPDAFPTCQLVMGFTRMEPGSVWNTMPPHTHLRRSEVYLYFGLPENHAVMHFMGPPQSTRHLVVRDLEAVMSPVWSIHSGAGTAAYSFVWAMGGENQEFADMDAAPVTSLR